MAWPTMTSWAVEAGRGRVSAGETWNSAPVTVRAATATMAGETSSPNTRVNFPTRFSVLKNLFLV